MTYSGAWHRRDECSILRVQHGHQLDRCIGHCNQPIDQLIADMTELLVAMSDILLLLIPNTTGTSNMHASKLSWHGISPCTNELVIAVQVQSVELVRHQSASINQSTNPST
jgi:hypothetical protein